MQLRRSYLANQARFSRLRFRKLEENLWPFLIQRGRPHNPPRWSPIIIPQGPFAAHTIDEYSDLHPVPLISYPGLGPACYRVETPVPPYPNL